MSLNYGTLKTKILADAHRTGLTAEVAGFVRAAESAIYALLRCGEMIKRTDLTDSDRVTTDEGFYTLPTDFLEERAFFLNGGKIMLESVSLAELRWVDGSTPVRHFTIISDAEIEFRGVPSTTDEIEVIYFARPTAFSADPDVNDILTRYEGIYLDAAKAELYLFTQDLELAATHSAAALAQIEALNEQGGRMIGGARQAPGYCLSSFGAR